MFLLDRLSPRSRARQSRPGLIGGPGSSAPDRHLRGDLPARPEGPTGLSTISHLGLITTSIGIGTAAGHRGGDLHILNHHHLQGLAVHGGGMIDHGPAHHDMRVSSGLHHTLPFRNPRHRRRRGMAGVRCSTASCRRRCSCDAVVGGDANWWMSYAALAMGCSGSLSLRFISIFFRPAGPGAAPRTHEPPRWMRFAGGAAGAGLPGGRGVQHHIEPILHVAAVATLGPRCRNTTWRCGTASTFRC